MYKIKFINIDATSSIHQELPSMVQYMYSHVNDIIEVQLTKDDHEFTWSDCTDPDDPYPIWVKFVDGECHGCMTMFDGFAQIIEQVRYEK